MQIDLKMLAFQRTMLPLVIEQINNSDLSNIDIGNGSLSGNIIAAAYQEFKGKLPDNPELVAKTFTAAFLSR